VRSACQNGPMPKNSAVSRHPVARGEAKRLLLESARELFAERGYAGTSTREIAKAAAVSEPMIFRHFGSKAGLFEEAVLAPFNAFVSDYITNWSERPRGVRSDIDEAREFYSGVYDVLSANRRLIQEMMCARASQGAVASDGPTGPQLGAILERFESVIQRERDDRGFHSFDPSVMTRLMFGLVFSIAVHGDWMFDGAKKKRPSAEAFIDEMARLTIDGAYSGKSKRTAR